MTFLSKCLSLMLTQTPCHKAAQCTSSGLIKAEHTEYRGTESQVYCFHSDIKFFFFVLHQWNERKHNCTMRWLLYDLAFFYPHIWRCALFPHHFLKVWGGGSKSAAEQTGEDVTGPGNKALLITVSAKKPANSSEASPDQSTSSSPADYFTAAPIASTGRASSCCSWLCNTKKTQSLICTGRWKERKQKHKKKWEMTVSQMNGYSDAHTLEQSFFWHAPNQKQNDLHAR